ncbi:MAG: hypothetical protein A2Y94_03985 [Caldithrix sp. RBG_13_44_9]|nr:MAG: hypothetical protein A2Y94_03985 [Caldithrix sp. RBG_13_44_9]
MTTSNKNKNRRTNRLGNENSPYLLQHAHNPVDWYSWGEDAFNAARQGNKPVMLSIGYSACHWCHVMAHESFEDEAIARLMNQYFVNIKVDREEYPDVDHFYQSFVQMTTGRGGWPLTVFLTPDKVPFYGGTYFPAASRYELISFPDLLNRIHDIYQHDNQKVLQNAAEIRQYFEKNETVQGGSELPAARKALDSFYLYLEKAFDRKYGGFIAAPKFPHVSDMEFLLNYYHHTGEQRAREIVLFTLKKMACGGIYDQIGGGFHRYSTDEKWLAPHFEKMLYDNALLIGVYVNAFRLTGEEFYRQIAKETADFVLRELTDPAGGFYSSLDADSEGHEGKFYLWSYDEIKKVLDKDHNEIFCRYYDITPAGNFEGENIPHIERPLEVKLNDDPIGIGKLRSQLEDSRRRLLQIRNSRIRPALDNKILVDWNGMMISALWEVYQITGNAIYQTAAEKAVKFLLDNFMASEFALFHSIKNDQNKIRGYIDDYAFFIQSLLDSFEIAQQQEYLQNAINLTEYSLLHFWDEQGGGFYFSDHRFQNLIIRQKQLYDSATPAGNHIMCLNLLRLHHYTANPAYLKKSEQILQLAKSDLENRGAAVPSLMKALSLYHFSPLEITLSQLKPEIKSHLSEIWYKIYLPNKLVIQIVPGPPNNLLSPELFRDRQVADRPALFICHKSTCSLPIFDADQFFASLEKLNLKIK